MELEAAGPVLGVDAAEGEAHAEAQVGRARGQRRERAVVAPAISPSRLVGGALLQGQQPAVLDAELLQGGGHEGHAAEVGEALVLEGALAEGPEVREDVVGDAAALVRDADDDVLLGLAQRHVDGGRLLGGRVPAAAAVLLDDGLDRVAEQLADDVLEVAEDVGERGVQVAADPDLRDLGAGRVGGPREVLYGFGAVLDDVLGDTLDEYLADELALRELGAGGEPVRVECFG